MPSATSTRLPSAFSRLAWSNLAAQTAEQVGLAATPVVAVLALGAGAGETGLLQTAQTLPFLLLAVPAGVLADRALRRQLMVWAEGLRVVSLLGVLGPLAGLAAAVVMVPTIWIPSAWLAALSFFLIGAGPLLWTISTTTLRQSVTPGEMLAESLPSSSRRRTAHGRVVRRSGRLWAARTGRSFASWWRHSGSWCRRW